jgi:hypothetical protein
MRRTLLTAGVFALLAMIYVPTPSQRFVHPGYRFIFSSEDTSIAFFQLLLNVGFAALLGAILATIVPNISRRTLFLTEGCIAVVALGVGVFAFCQAAAIRAQSDEENAEELIRWPRASETMYAKFRNAARNWRLALRFDEATRVENRIKETKASPPPSPKKYISTDPNAGQMPPATQGELPAITVNSGELNLPIEIRLVCPQEGQDPFAWLSITRHNKEQERYFEPYHTKMVSMYRPVVEKLVDGTYEVTFTEERP